MIIQFVRSLPILRKFVSSTFAIDLIKKNFIVV